VGVSFNDRTPARAPRVNVTVDRVVFGGLDPAARSAFLNGLRTHLSRILADPAMLASLCPESGSRRTPVLRLERVSLQPGNAGARNLGAKVARAIATSGNARGS